MRKLMSLLMLVVAISVSAQVKVFKASYGEVTLTEDWTEAESMELTANILISYDSEKGIIKLFGTKTTTTYYVRESELIADESEDSPRSTLIFSAVDGNGNECALLVTWYDETGASFSGYEYRWRFISKDYWIGYYCNIAE